MSDVARVLMNLIDASVSMHSCIDVMAHSFNHDARVRHLVEKSRGELLAAIEAMGALAPKPSPDQESIQ